MASKKNLVVLLIMPFAISILSFTAINMTFNLIDNDILNIDWDYKDNESFALTNDLYAHRLKATAINDRNYPTAQALVWSVYNSDVTDLDNHAEIITRGNESYLHTLSVGNVVITVSNDKGNVQKKMNAIIYNNNVIVFNTTSKGSQSNVDSKIYYGEYDINDRGTKVLSSFSYTLESECLNHDSKAVLKENSNNVEVDEEKNLVKFKYSGEAYLTFGFDSPSYEDTYTYNFTIVEDGVNVYNYDDLLYCTNKSKNGEIAVLRKHLESYSNTFVLDQNGRSTGVKKNNETELFGKYNNGKYSFKNEIYQFETKYNQEYIKQWNEFARNNSGYKPVTDLVNVGIHVQKDFYGNGFTINLHNLTYPYQTMSVIDQDGNTQLVPQLSDDNLFRGPLPYYTLGDPNNMPLVTAYGQDNIGMYVEGEGITINDVNIKNCDFGNNLANLDTVGTVMEVYGKDITIKNSRLSNGKTVFRSFGDKENDNTKVLLDNCMLSYSRNFLASTGNYNFNKVDGTRSYQFIHTDGSRRMSKIDEYLAANLTGEKSDGDLALQKYLMGDGDEKTLIETMKSIQAGLDLFKTPGNRYYGDLTIRDCLFYRSGISSIALETLFNGPFLYNSTPTYVQNLFSKASDLLDDSSLVPLFPSEVGGISYPVEVKLSGSTRFYDYKTPNLLDINGLVGENISTIIGTYAPDYAGLITLDNIFPIKDVLLEGGKETGALYSKDGESNINVPIAFYGGGLNNSRVLCDETFTYREHLVNLDSDPDNVDAMDVDFLKAYSKLPKAEGGGMSAYANIVLKCVTIVSGFNPFKFTLAKGDGYLYNEAPKVQDLVNNAK